MDDSILPQDEIENMKREIRMLKRQQGIEEEPSESDLKEHMASLSNSIRSLLGVFKEANEELKMDTHDAVLVSQKIDGIIDRLDKIEIQNEKIAKGIVAVADMVEELQAGSLSREVPKTTTPKNPSPPPKPLPQYNMPKQEEKKKGFLNFGP